MHQGATNTVLLVCDVWDNHYCKDLQRRMGPLAERIDKFASIVRQRGGHVLHCPSQTVDTYYNSWPQRKTMRKYPFARPVISEKMQTVKLPLDTTLTTGCPDIPPCPVHSDFTKQHEGIKILPRDLISDSGQEVYNFIKAENIDCVLMTGTVLNMCIMGRPFGVQALVNRRIPVRVVGDLVEVFYSPLESPNISIDQAKWFILGYIKAKWCPVTTTYKELLDVSCCKVTYP
ncbi:hypothetical protein LCGC14_0990510 [marine sediment metagenome]|uniref:Isochorismatase-like domain-containing protein n=1 Tax=marine sediment metagenome TaxID=412755 RepID=A0A0F9NSH2_9ZZZZ